MDTVRELSKPGQALSKDAPTATTNNPAWWVGGEPTLARDLLHERLIDEARAAAPDVEQQYRAIVLAGPPGAGKSTVLADVLGEHRGKYLVIDADEFARSPRLNPRHRPGARVPARDDLQAVAQRAGKSARGIGHDDKAEQVDARDKARRPLLCGHLSSGQAPQVRPSDHNSADDATGLLRPVVIRDGRSRDQCGKRGLTRATVCTDDPERRPVADVLERQSVGRFGRRHAELRSSRTGRNR